MANTTVAAPIVRRLAEPAEAELVAAFFDELDPELSVGSIWLDYSLEEYDFYVLEVEGHIIGMAMVLYKPEESLLVCGNQVKELSRLIIEPGSRRQGLGRYFVERILEDHPSLVLTSTDSARPFWSSLSQFRFLADIASFLLFATHPAYELVHPKV